jgi:hypothetical protein
MGYYGRFTAKKNRESDLWEINDDERRDTPIINSIDNQNLAYQIATQLNDAYQLGINDGMNLVQNKFSKLLFSK